MKTKLSKKKKRILFPWLRDKDGKLYKTMLAVIAKKNGWSEVLSGKRTFIKQIKIWIKEVEKFFPKMYSKISAFYLERGRVLDKKEYEVIVVGRFRMMVGYNRQKKEIEIYSENPYTNIKKFGKLISQCEYILIKSKNFKKPYSKGNNLRFSCLY